MSYLKRRTRIEVPQTRVNAGLIIPISICLSGTVSISFSGKCVRMVLYVLVFPHNERETDNSFGYFTNEDISLIAVPTIGQNVTVSHIGALHVPCKETVGSEQCIN